MDHDETQNPFSPPMPFPPNAMPFSDSLQFEFESRSTGAGESLLGVPRPLECLYETPVPPFLLKTFDLVDDPSLDTIISWGAKGNSFVVWDHVEFARMILPKNFKHNNFSSFVRQLNTYGFRKIDADKWEFANEDFLRGQRHLLKNIQRLRRKSPPSQQIGSSSSETGKAELEDELEHLIKERSSIVQEVIELQHQQRGTVQHMEVVNEKLNAAEKRQKHMVSFLARMFQNPSFLARLKQTREKTHISSPKTMRKFVKHQKHEPGTSSSSPEGQIVKCEPGLGNFKESPSLHLEDTGENPVFGSEFGAFQIGDDSPQDELEMVNELLNIPELVPTLGTIDPLLKGKGIAGPCSSETEYFGPFPDNNKNISEFSVPVMDDIWNMGFEASAGMSSSSTELWGNFSSYNVPESSCGLSDIWDAVSWHPAGSSEKEKWQDDDDFPSYELENQDGKPWQNILEETDP